MSKLDSMHAFLAALAMQPLPAPGPPTEAEGEACSRSGPMSGWQIAGNVYILHGAPPGTLESLLAARGQTSGPSGTP